MRVQVAWQAARRPDLQLRTATCNEARKVQVVLEPALAVQVPEFLDALVPVPGAIPESHGAADGDDAADDASGRALLVWISSRPDANSDELGASAQEVTKRAVSSGQV
jgi:hypothetical protein